MTRADSPEPLARVLAAAQAQVAVRLELAAAVTQARAAGHTWAELGEVLGMSRQAVFKRFGSTAAEPVWGAARPVSHLERLARAVFDDLVAGRFEQVRGQMTAETAEALSEQTLRTTWAAAVRALGTMQTAELLGVEQEGRTHVEQDEQLAGPVVVSLALHHERGEWHGRVAYDGADHVVGLLILPPGAAAPF